MEDEDMSKAILFPVDLLDLDEMRVVMDQNVRGLEYWLRLVTQAKRMAFNAANGEIRCHVRNTPLRAEQFSRRWGGTLDEWVDFLDTCVNVGFLSDEDGVYRLCDVKLYLRNPSDAPEATAARKAKSRAVSRHVTSESRPVTPVTTEQNRTEPEPEQEPEVKGTVLEGELEFKKLLKPLALSWNGETTKRLRKFCSLPNSVEHKLSALNMSLSRLREGKIQNNAYAVWNVLDDAYRNINLVYFLPSKTAPDRLELANEQRRKAMGVAR